MEKPGWRVIASSYVIDTPYLRLRKDTIELPDGTVIDDYYVRESRGYVIVFAVTPENEVVLVRQYKHGIGKVILELPAGAIDRDETPLETAIRELAEETGYEAESMESLGSYITEPTNSNARVYLFLALNAEPTGTQQLDITETIDVELASFDELRELVRDGVIDSLPHVGAIHITFDHLAE